MNSTYLCKPRHCLAKQMFETWVISVVWWCDWSLYFKMNSSSGLFSFHWPNRSNHWKLAFFFCCTRFLRKKKKEVWFSIRWLFITWCIKTQKYNRKRLKAWDSHPDKLKFQVKTAASGACCAPELLQHTMLRMMDSCVASVIHENVGKAFNLRAKSSLKCDRVRSEWLDRVGYEGPGCYVWPLISKLLF